MRDWFRSWMGKLLIYVFWSMGYVLFGMKLNWLLLCVFLVMIGG